MSEREALPEELLAELQALIDASLRGEIRGQQIARLEQLLHDPASRDFYLNTVWESDVLATWAKTSEEERLAAARHNSLSRRVAHWPLLGFLYLSLRLAGQAMARHPVASTLVALSAIVPLAIWLASPPSQPQVAQNTEVSRPLSHVSSPVIVASLARTVDCVWSGDSRGPTSPMGPKAGDDLAVGRKLVLKSGLAEIVFQNGVESILQGPATVVVRSSTSMALDRGKLSIKVKKPSARGFAVVAPGMKYTDLGTEFGVLVAESGEQEVHVFRGKVRAEEASCRVQGEGSKEHRAQRAAPMMLSAHEAIRVAVPDAAGNQDKPIRRIAADEARFVRAILDPFPLFGTGVGMDRGKSDPHWEITKISTEANFKPQPAVVVVPEPNYARDNRNKAQWVSNTEPKHNWPVGCRWTLRTHFDLTGFDPSTARIEGQTCADNYVVDIRVNGKAAPIPPGNREEALLARWLPLKIEEGFVSGRNTLEIVLENGDGTGPGNPVASASPMALCLELKGLAQRSLKPKGR